VGSSIFFVKIYTSLGREILNKQYSNTSFIPIEIMGSEGIYIVKVFDEKGNEAVVRILKE